MWGSFIILALTFDMLFLTIYFLIVGRLDHLIYKIKRTPFVKLMSSKHSSSPRKILEESYCDNIPIHQHQALIREAARVATTFSEVHMMFAD